MMMKIATIKRLRIRKFYQLVGSRLGICNSSIWYLSQRVSRPKSESNERVNSSSGARQSHNLSECATKVKFTRWTGQAERDRLEKAYDRVKIGILLSNSTGRFTTLVWRTSGGQTGRVPKPIARVPANLWEQYPSSESTVDPLWAGVRFNPKILAQSNLKFTEDSPETRRSVLISSFTFQIKAY